MRIKDLKEKQRRQRQAMIEECIKLGIWEDRDDVKRWIKKEFRLDLPVEDISTEYTLSEKQTRLFYMWLKHFLGQGPKPNINRDNTKVTGAQQLRIAELQVAVGYNPTQLADFIQRQTGKRKIASVLFKDEATMVITGLEQILKETQPYTHE